MKIDETFENDCIKKANDIAQLVIGKRKDYGTKNIMNNVVGPHIAITVRLSDKISRLANILQTKGKPVHESLMETAQDIAGYAIVLQMVIDGTFELPLDEPPKK